MYLFQISGYDDPGLDAETAELFRQRLEEHSRRTAPRMWRMTDKLNAAASKDPGKEKARRTRYRVFGVILMVLGALVLLQGIMEPDPPGLILTGAVILACAFFEFRLARTKRPLRTPASCRREAEKLLAGRRAVNWAEADVKVRFDEDGMTISGGEKEETVPYGRMTGLYETEHLWLLVYGGEKGLLLQKKDMVSGEPEDFSAQLRREIAAAGEGTPEGTTE